MKVAALYTAAKLLSILGVQLSFWIKCGCLSSALFFLFALLLFYKDSEELISSISAAFLSALLFLLSFIMIGWLVQVFKK